MDSLFVQVARMFFGVFSSNKMSRFLSIIMKTKAYRTNHHSRKLILSISVSFIPEDMICWVQMVLLAVWHYVGISHLDSYKCFPSVLAEK